MADTGISLAFHRETKEFLEKLQKTKWAEKGLAPDNFQLEEMRSAAEAMGELGTKVEFDGKRKEFFVPFEDVPDGIPVYIYEPETVPSDAPILIYFHGGGNIIGSRHMSDATCKLLSSLAGCIVVNVEYRLMPEHMYPASIDDGKVVLKWVHKNKNKLAGSDRSKVGVAGDSMGGNISASLSQTESGIDFQIMIYTYLFGNTLNLQSYKTFKDGPIVTEASMKWIGSYFASVPEKLKDPRYSVLLNENFDHLPPTLFIVAELDPLRDDSYEYSKRLTAAGVHNEVHVAQGAPHGFFCVPGIFVELCGEANAKAAEFIRKYGAP